MALQGDERRLIAEANLHLPGRQVDPRQVQRDLWRLGQWERAARPRPAPRGRGAGHAPPRRLARRAGFTAAWPHSTPATTPASSSTGPLAPPLARAKGIGFDDEALSKPIIGVASTWTETMPCNYQMRAQAAKTRDGIREAGGTAMEFNTIVVTDGISMGTPGHARLARCAAR